MKCGYEAPITYNAMNKGESNDLNLIAAQRTVLVQVPVLVHVQGIIALERVRYS